MSNGAPAPEKKGLHPLAWVGIGCGVIAVIVVVALMIGGFFLARTAKNFAEDFEDNPGLAAARLIVKASPELEEVSVDEEAGTMTVRNTKTGEIITVDFEDIEHGRFSWTAGDEEVTVDLSEADEGTVRIESSDGDGFKLTTGDAATGEIPDWLPVYPGTEPTNRGSLQTDDSVSGNYTATSEASVSEVTQFFREQLEAAGFSVNVTTFTGEGNEGAMVNGSSEAEGKTVVVVINRDEGATAVNVSFNAER